MSNDRMSSLDLSQLSLTSIPEPTGTSLRLFTVTHLVLLSCHISHWSDIDALEQWTEGRLESLRFTLASSDSAALGDEEDDIPRAKNHDPPDPTRITGHAETDRPFFIAKLSGLVSLNSSPVSASERRDAERWYVTSIAKLGRDGADELWGRCGELKGKYEDHAVVPVEAPRSAALRSKMISGWFGVSSAIHS